MYVVESTRIAPEATRKRNNYLRDEGGRYIIRSIKYLIIFETLLGINRQYLTAPRKCLLRLSYTYSIILLISIFSLTTIDDIYIVTQTVYKYIMGIELLLLATNAMFLQKKQLNKFFSKLQSFDECINICEAISQTSPASHYVLGISAVLLCSLIEHVLYTVYAANTYGVFTSMYAMYLSIIVHDVEIIFVCILLLMILRRLRVVKAHVAKVFSIDTKKRNCKENNTVEDLSKKIELDVSSLHKTFDLLNKCSKQLNRLMRFPVTVILVASGMSTILIVKGMIFLMQNVMYYDSDDSPITAISFIFVGRCLKLIILLTFPCYISNLCKIQVDIIRTMVHDILNNHQLDKIERRKVKAFSQLCHDNAFSYELWGVVRLDMSLPLSYSSLCTTYLIIIVQFSKFID